MLCFVGCSSCLDVLDQRHNFLLVWICSLSEEGIIIPFSGSQFSNKKCNVRVRIRGIAGTAWSLLAWILDRIRTVPGSATPVVEGSTVFVGHCFCAWMNRQSTNKFDQFASPFTPFFSPFTLNVMSFFTHSHMTWWITRNQHPLNRPPHQWGEVSQAGGAWGHLGDGGGSEEVPRKGEEWGVRSELEQWGWDGYDDGYGSWSYFVEMFSF